MFFLYQNASKSVWDAILTFPLPDRRLRCSVRNIISEAVAEHALPVCFPDTIALTKPAEGMPAGVWAFFFYAQLPQRSLHIPPKLGDALAAEKHRPLLFHHALDPWITLSCSLRKYNLLFLDGYVIISITEMRCARGQFQNSSFSPEWNGF